MTDADEAPSSLADLETLAGLDAERTATGADSTQTSDADPDAGDFDLSRLATSSASAAVSVTPLDIGAGDEAPLDLGAAVVDGAPAEFASATTTPVSKPAPRGFWAGVLAGAVVAGVVAAVLWARAPSAHTSAEVAGSSDVRSSLPGTPSGSGPVLASAAPASAAASAVPSAPESPEPVAPVSPSASVELPSAATHAGAVSSPSRRPQGGGTAVAHTGVARSSAPAAEQAAPSDPTAPPARVAPASAPRATGPGAMDSLLDEALTGKRRPQGVPDPFADGVPTTPSADDVTRAIQVLLPAIRGCAMGQSGVAQTLLIARSDGTVASVQVTGSPYGGTASGSCMEGVLRRAKLPRFKQSVFRVQFPLSIRAPS